jgi:predicted N-acetyltransferase YhbS
MAAALVPTIEHLFRVPQHRLAMAALIHHEFWQHVPGASVQRMFDRLGQADRADAVPLCLVALYGGQPVGVVNLVDSDDDNHPEWHPWLAGLVVAEPWRGQGVGSALVRTLLDLARRQQLPRVFFGTDGPGFYRRLGAVVQEQPRDDFWFMRFDLDAG